MKIEENEITKSVLKNKESSFILLYRIRTQKKKNNFIWNNISIGASEWYFLIEETLNRYLTFYREQKRKYILVWFECFFKRLHFSYISPNIQDMMCRLPHFFWIPWERFCYYFLLNASIQLIDLELVLIKIYYLIFSSHN